MTIFVSLLLSDRKSTIPQQKQSTYWTALNLLPHPQQQPSVQQQSRQLPSDKSPLGPTSTTLSSRWRLQKTNGTSHQKIFGDRKQRPCHQMGIFWCHHKSYQKRARGWNYKNNNNGKFYNYNKNYYNKKYNLRPLIEAPQKYPPTPPTNAVWIQHNQKSRTSLGQLAAIGIGSGITEAANTVSSSMIGEAPLSWGGQALGTVFGLRMYRP